MNRQFRRALVATVGVSVLGLAACGGNQLGGMDHDPGGGPISASASPSGSGTATIPAAAVNPADLMFVVMMIPHHEQAVRMSDLLLAKSGVDADVRALAEQIKAAQQPEIDQMETWLEDRGTDHESAMGGPDHAGHMEGMLSAEEIEKLGEADGPTGQRLFLEGMIAHHQGAIEMANNVLGVGQDPAVMKLAEAIVATQQTEIDKMETMLGR